MCGIVALIGGDGEEIVTNALRKIGHRGKDGAQILSLNNLSIGFNRLAINDKSNQGMQPWQHANLVGVFNGEIYNFQELKSEFRIETTSECDTEVILPLFEIFGTDVIDYLDGFYSGIIANTETNQVYLLRDIFGKKPMFFGDMLGGRFVTSELKAIDKVSRFTVVPKGVSIIEDNQLTILKTHHVKVIPKDRLAKAISESVRKRIPVSERSFGVFLSGGLDSSIIACIVSELSQNVTYYVLGDENSEDVKFARLLGERLGILEAIKVIPIPHDDLLDELIETLVYHTESYNPSVISNGLATYLLSKEVNKDGLQVVLSGEGADELFCGYNLGARAEQWFNAREELIENMHTTELRRLDMSSMANTVEVRSPFLDRTVYGCSLDCLLPDLLESTDEGIRGKKILRELFSDYLPAEIWGRKKVSFDVGSGIRRLVVNHLIRNGKTERTELKQVWDNLFEFRFPKHEFFHSYPTFDTVISKRGITSK
jgi:asparagine synthase (glutamine-hydrolysing)